VDDPTRQVDSPVRESYSCLIGVVDRSVDPIAKAELRGEVNHQTSVLPDKIQALDVVDELAVTVLGQRAGYRVLEIEAFSEDGSSHPSITRC